MTHLIPVVAQGPRSVFPGRAATEVVACHQHAGVPVGRLVQYKVLLGCTVGVVAPRREEGVFETRTLNTLQKHGRDDLVGVDVDPV